MIIDVWGVAQDSKGRRFPREIKHIDTLWREKAVEKRKRMPRR